MRVFLALDNRFVFGLADRYVHDPFGELVHVAWSRRGLAHACQYGAPRHGLQRRSGMPPIKLSHYRGAVCP